MKSTLFAFALLAACGSATTELIDTETSCASNEACVATQVCVDINEETGLGTCVDVEANACTDDLDCGDGLECGETGVCERIAPTWRYVAIVSQTSSPNEINDDPAPGPDIDAIEVIHEGVSRFATVVHVSQQGLGGPPPAGNVYARPSAILGAPDAMATANCDLSTDPEPLFWSMGDDNGFVVVGFDAPFEEGDTLRVWELAASGCDNVTIQRSDVFDVYVSNITSPLEEITDERQIRSPGWQLAASSDARGGVVETTLAF